jgi:hypothetical protein
MARSQTVMRAFAKPSLVAFFPGSFVDDRGGAASHWERSALPPNEQKKI